MVAKKTFFYAIYGPQFEGIVHSFREYNEKVNGKKNTYGKKFEDEQLALQWIEGKKPKKECKLFYAVHRPEQQIIVHTLEQYNFETKGHPFVQGKKFNTKKEAEDWLQEKKNKLQKAQKVKTQKAKTKVQKVKAQKPQKPQEPVIVKPVVSYCTPDQRAVIYIDGGFKDGFGKYAFVVFSYRDNVKLYQDFGFVYESTFNELMNVGAEMMACLRALEWAFGNGVKDVHLIYDYEGIISHVSHQTTKEAIQVYQKMMLAFQAHMQIHFLHVRHANKERHQMAHKLTQLSI